MLGVRSGRGGVGLGLQRASSREAKGRGVKDGTWKTTVPGPQGPTASRWPYPVGQTARGIQDMPCTHGMQLTCPPAFVKNLISGRMLLTASPVTSIRARFPRW